MCGPARDEAISDTGRKPGDSANAFDVPAFVYSFGCYYGQERVASVEMTYDW